MTEQILESRAPQFRIHRHPNETAHNQRVDQVNMRRSVAEHHGDAVSCDKSMLVEPALQLRDTLRGFGTSDRMVVQMKNRSARRLAQAGQDQWRAIQPIVRITLREIVGVSVHIGRVGKCRVARFNACRA